MKINSLREWYAPRRDRRYRSQTSLESIIPAHVESLEERLGINPGDITPENCVVYICGLHGTISQTLIALFKRGFIPDERKLRIALDISPDIPASIFFERYDATPVIDLSNRDFLEELKKSFPLHTDQET